MLAIVELALFKVPTGGYIAQPRVLARTTNIDRGIVTVDGEGRVSIGPAIGVRTSASTPGEKMTITKELYLEKLEGKFPGISQLLNRFIDKLETYSVLPEFGTDSMILRWWRPDDTQKWNLGQIASSGQVFTDVLSLQAGSAGLTEMLMRYLNRLKALVPDAYLKQSKSGAAWGVVKDDKSITVNFLLADEAHEDEWLQAIAEFQTAVARALQND